MKRGEVIVVVGLLCLGLGWSWSGGIYDLRSPLPRVALTLLSIVSSFAMMWVGMTLANVPRAIRAEAAIWAILPWNSLLLSQLPYVGYLFLPIEVLASILLLRRRALLSLPMAACLAVLTRAASFGLVAFGAMLAKTWLPR
jgi:hypothetical protein